MSFESLIAESLHYWPSQELSGNLVDSVGGLDLIPYFTPTYRNAGPTAWLPFSVGMTLPSNFNSLPTLGVASTARLSACVWHLKPVASSIVIIHSGWFLGVDGALKLRFYWDASLPFATSSLGVSLGSWDFLGCTWDSVADEVRFVVNGSTDTVAFSGGIPPADRPFEYAFPDYGSGSNGLYCGCAVWSRVLSPSEFAELRAGPVTPPPPVVAVGARVFRGGGKTRRAGVRW